MIKNDILRSYEPLSHVKTESYASKRIRLLNKMCLAIPQKDYKSPPFELSYGCNVMIGSRVCIGEFADIGADSVVTK